MLSMLTEFGGSDRNILISFKLFLRDSVVASAEHMVGSQVRKMFFLLDFAKSCLKYFFEFVLQCLLSKKTSFLSLGEDGVLGSVERDPLLGWYADCSAAGE
jgi:hypothetical protein